jgi:hypothetical protein
MAVLKRQGKVRFTDSEWQAKLKDEPFAYQVGLYKLHPVDT